ncbi:hypothetical protein OIU74_022827 [Salix koriyanagi]|uniref:Uncharacterized protein n=1 Tax=Salix koriyanagi TaxID=2511006 RepID=A0A9Q0WL58_9ROSI|nr:hypothetical protein OIU74_022827 [Salix koriyanagi]
MGLYGLVKASREIGPVGLQFSCLRATRQQPNGSIPSTSAEPSMKMGSFQDFATCFNQKQKPDWLGINLLLLSGAAGVFRICDEQSFLKLDRNDIQSSEQIIGGTTPVRGRGQAVPGVHGKGWRFWMKN